MEATVRVTTDADRVATILFDVPGKSVNTLAKQVWADLNRAIEQVESEKPRAVILASGKPKSFIAGADLKVLSSLQGEDLRDLIELGQATFQKLAGLPYVTIAAIHGACVGGGYELALACDWRVASDSSATKIGLPETNLGILPAGGGTTRLPRLIGLPAAWPLILGVNVRSAGAA